MSGEVGKGLALGWFDEIQGAEAVAQEALRSPWETTKDIFGYGSKPGSALDRYAPIVEALRQRDDAYEAANPKTAFGLQLGGAMLPALVTGGAGLVTGGAKAAATTGGSSAGRSLARNLFGVGIESAPTLGQLAKMGIVGGGAYGAGEADEGDRLWGAAKGAGVGAVAVPIVGRGVQVGANSLADLLTNYGIIGTGATPARASELGAVNLGGGGVKYTPEELILAKQLKNTPIDKVRSAANEMAVTGDDVPLFLPEALQSPKVNRNARFVANYEPSLEFSQSAIEGRTKDAATRATDLFDVVSPDRGAFTGASRMAKAADDIIKGAEKSRADEAFPLYAEAYKDVPTIKSSALTDLMENDRVLTGAIKKVKETANNAKLPDNSARILVKARQEISNRIDSEMSRGMGRAARDLTDTYNQLNNILHNESPLLAQADQAFASASTGIDELTGTFLNSLRNMTDDKVSNVNQIFNLPAERISKLRDTFDAAGKLDEWNAGVRSYMQTAVEGTKEGRNFVDKLTGTTLAKNKLQAALGDSYEQVAKGLAYEGRMFEGKNKYHTGSSTAGNLAEASEFQKGVGVIRKLVNKDFEGAFKALTSGDMKDETAQALARIYFDPKQGRGAIEKILPLLEQYGANQKFATGAGNLGAIDATRSVPGSGGSSQNPRPPLREGGKAASPKPAASTNSKGLEKISLQQQSLGSSYKDPRLFLASAQGLSGGDLSLFDDAGSDLFNIGDDMDDKPKDVAQVEALIDQDPIDAAIYQVESSRNPLAKNKNSTASGGFQLISKTAKALGVKDVFDLADNYQGYKKLREENEERFKTSDPLTIYAAHFLGAPLLDKWRKGKGLTKDEAAQVKELREKALPRFKEAYELIVSQKSGSIET